jgi:diacylglycerol kinase family enzyme
MLRVMRRVLFLVNPMRALRGNRRALVERCAAMVRAEGSAAEVWETVSAGSAGEQAREAVENGFDAVFACGGDGTFFQALQGVAGSDAALGVLPLGTGNVLARNLRLPRGVLAAFLAQKDAEAVSIPLGEIVCAGAGECERSWYFTIAAGIGIHAAVIDVAASSGGKRRWGRASYYTHGMRLLLRHAVQPFDVRMTGVDGEVREFRACELLAVRVPAIDRWRAGGDLRSPNLRVAAVPHTGRVGLAHAGFHAVVTRSGRSGAIEERRLPYPQYEDAVEVVCRPAAEFAYQAPLLVEADGEVIGVERVTLRMAEKQLRLLWPDG